MHCSLISCRDFAKANSSPSVICIAILPCRATGNVVHFMYDNKPNFHEGQRVLSVQKSNSPDSKYDCFKRPSRECIGCDPVPMYTPQSLTNKRVPPDDDHAVHTICTPYLHTERKLTVQPRNVPHTKFSLASDDDLHVTSMKYVSNFDLEHEEDEQLDTHDGVGRFQTPLGQPLGKGFNQLDFARVYNLVALRVSLAESESLAYRLKGHLLNWPRINNIARVDGDDMDWDPESFWTRTDERKVESIEDSLLRAVYGSIAPPTPLKKRLNAAEKLSPCRFRYLESLSRPGYEAMRENRKKMEVHNTNRSPRKYYMVELDDCCDGKLGSCRFGMKKWIGPFRLLLLDTKYEGQPVSKLPVAVQMLLNECKGHYKWGPRREIVHCKLSLFYDYWSMEEILNHLLSREELMPMPAKIMGHIAVLSLGEQYSSVKYLIGKVVLDKQRPKVKTVINKLEPLEDNYHPAFEVLAGNHSVVTTIVEDEVPFLINLATVYCDPELTSERQRLIKKFSKKDIVCDVVAGAGLLTLTAAKKVWRVFANDANLEALKYLGRNVAENQLQAKVEVCRTDV